MSIVGFRAENHPQQIGKSGALDRVDDRGTDLAFFEMISARFGVFDLDVAASARNAKCARYFTVVDDGLTQHWADKVWCNPPYSDCRSWVEKAWASWRNGDCSAIVMLLPANRTEQAWWQDLIEPVRD